MGGRIAAGGTAASSDNLAGSMIWRSVVRMALKERPPLKPAPVKRPISPQ